jgi:nicotinate-nucleotide adenylyltransferase
MHPLARYDSALLFGGSFDPPHRAHVALPRRVAEAVGAQVVAYLPAGRAPHKLDQEQTAPHHRLAMLRLALADEPGTLILTDEIDRGPDEPSYTVDTLERLHKSLGEGTRLRLLFGGDQLRIFDQWREPERIVELAEPVVMVRPPDTAASLLAALPDDAARAAWTSRLIEVPRMQVSSTRVRERVAGGQPIDGLVAPPVARYIAEHGLYRAPGV